ncbi:hypothetical protein [Rhodospira trueperi]|uniref:Uncharacterized protein n=1 Tax=Rhodospira trueperi TaxID=69960 RepID=A0A1G7FFV5_9PROT|nr:hypothetical protein [Rhodospira trueperi]SDE74738.1 hypothetical protein SAMN05421720_11149 [Rhodospira trueperi]
MREEDKDESVTGKGATRSKHWLRPSRLTVIAVLFFAGIGLILAAVWMLGDVIVFAGRGMSILLLGMAFIIALNVTAIVLMLVLLRTLKGRDE